MPSRNLLIFFVPISERYVSEPQADGWAPDSQSAAVWQVSGIKGERRDNDLIRIYESFVRYFCDTAVE